MTAPVGTDAFTTMQSKEAEDKHKRILGEHLQLKRGVEVRESVEIAEIASRHRYSLNKKGKSQEWEADGGWIYSNGELVGVAECKYQHSRQNACERAFRYLSVDKFREQPHRILLTCYGKGFQQQSGGGSTGPFIDMATNSGMTVFENPSDEEFKEGIEEWIRSIL
jgi:hypothetical protein|tara:strand:- start:1066 stop:1563 length:498 start_codon:yes stop_codon:yes gene_type:complete